MALAFLHGVGGGGKHLDDLKALIDRSITELEIPEGVEKIGAYAFDNCKALSSAIIPESVTYIDSYAFHDCSSLKSIDIPDSVSIMKQSVFHGCVNLESVKLPSELTALDANLFYQCAKITSITIPSKVKYVFGGALRCNNCLTFDFSACEQIPTLSNVNAFEGIHADAKIIVPASLYEEWIEATNWAAFKDYIVPTEPVPSKGFAYTHDYDNDCYILTGIGECTDTDLVIPATYDDGINGNKQVYLANEAFRENTNITSVNILEGVGGSDWCYAFAQCPLLERVEGLHYISSMFALTGCPSLSYVKFDKRVGEEGVGAYGFPDSRTDCVFDFSLVETIPTLGYDPYESYQTFENLGADGKIIVPAALYDAWIVDTNWAMHADHIVKAE